MPKQNNWGRKRNFCLAAQTFPSMVTTGPVPLNPCMLRDKHPDAEHVVECLPTALVDCLMTNEHTKRRTGKKGKTMFKNIPQWPTFAHPAPPYTFTTSHYVIMSWIHPSIYLLIRLDPPRSKHFPAARLPFLWQLSTHNESLGTVHIKPWKLLNDLWDISLFVLLLTSAPSLSKRKEFTVMLVLCTLLLKCQYSSPITLF